METASAPKNKIPQWLFLVIAFASLTLGRLAFLAFEHHRQNTFIRNIPATLSRLEELHVNIIDEMTPTERQDFVKAGRRLRDEKDGEAAARAAGQILERAIDRLPKNQREQLRSRF